MYYFCKKKIKPQFMKKKFTLLFVFLCSAPLWLGNAQESFETEGVIVPRTIKSQNNLLQLNGFGTRSKLWMDVYVQALYLTTLSNDPKEIIESDTEMAIRIQIISSMVTSNKLSKSLRKGMVKSVGEDKLQELKTPLGLLESLLNSQPTKDNDFFNLIYNPKEKSIWVYKNDKLEGKIPGFEFKKAFFGIWLSDNPVDEKLKDSLLNMFR
jgi:hypothetical protein